MTSPQATPSPSDSSKAWGFYNLPAEIRVQILEAALIRGKVALCPLRHIRERLPHWNHSPPVWGLLKAVSRRMQADAGHVVFSADNTFFLPIGDVMGHFAASAESEGRGEGGGGVLSRVRALDCPFDLRECLGDETDGEGEGGSLYQMAWDWVKRVSKYDSQRTVMKHPRSDELLLDRWVPRAKILDMLDLRLLRLDLSGCRCDRGCCRAIYFLLSAIMQGGRNFERLERLEIVGLKGWEARGFRSGFCDEGLRGRMWFFEHCRCLFERGPCGLMLALDCV